MNVITRQVKDISLTVTIEYPRLDSRTRDIIKKIRSLDFKISCNSNGEYFSLSLSDIYYVETVERKTFLYTEKEIYLSDKKLYELEQILRRNAFENFLLNIVIEYIAVSIFVLLYGYFFHWFVKANWWLVFLYVAIVYVPAYFLDIVIVKRDIAYINAQLERRRENENKF